MEDETQRPLRLVRLLVHTFRYNVCRGSRGSKRVRTCVAEGCKHLEEAKSDLELGGVQGAGAAQPETAGQVTGQGVTCVLVCMVGRAR